MRKRLIAALDIQTTGYRPKSMASDLILALVPGIDYILWGYAFAALVFTGGLANYLPLAVTLMLVSCALVGITVACTSTFAVNVAGIEEQAVAILATIAVLLNARMYQFAGPDAAAATMFVIMALSALLIGICFHLAAYFKLSPLIQLVPFPVVCGFLAGTGWLFFAAGISMMSDIEVEVTNLAPLWASDRLAHWLVALACGLALYVAIMLKDHFMTLPLALLACAGGFYAFAWWQGIPAEVLVRTGWMFDIDVSEGAKGISNLAFSQINIGFIVSVMPQIGTIVLITLLTASFSFSALELGTGKTLDLDVELRGHGTANILSAIGLGVPGSSEVASSLMLSRMGGTSRLLPLFCAALCLVAAVSGGEFIEYVPKVVMGALVFMAGIQFIHDWLLSACRQMHWPDIAVVWLIFAAIVVFGFIPGVVFGIVMTSVLFLIQYAKTDAVESSFTLDQLQSSVERSLTERSFIQEHGQDIRIFNLRGFLFFGSSSAFFERIKAICSDARTHDTKTPYFIFNFRRVTGIDSTAVQVFLKINNLLATKGIHPVFCGLDERVLSSFTVAKVFETNAALTFSGLDRATKYVEDRLLAEELKEGPKDIVAVLEDILGDHAKAAQLATIMERFTMDAGSCLFEQNDIETTLYILESGTVEIQVKDRDGRMVRLREFRHGAMIGEMAAYSTLRSRSASAIVTEAAVVYKLIPENIELLGAQASQYRAILHEMVARLLASRLSAMNRNVELNA